MVTTHISCWLHILMLFTVCIFILITLKKEYLFLTTGHAIIFLQYIQTGEKLC